MWPVVGAIVASAYDAYRGRKEASKARAWQADMSSTAHQREVSDLRAAGLNPILSGTGGAGASSPSSPVANVPSSADQVAKYRLHPEERALLREDRKKRAWDTAGARESAHLTESQDELVNEQLRRAKHETATAAEAAAQARIETEAVRAYLPGRLDEARMLGSKAYSYKRRADAGLDTLGKSLGSAAGVAAGVAGARIWGGAGRASKLGARWAGPTLRRYIRRAEPVLPVELR